MATSLIEGWTDGRTLRPDGREFEGVSDGGEQLSLLRRAAGSGVGPPSGEEATVMADSAPTYQQLLEEARELGRLDGRFAAAFEPPGADVSAGRCLGRSPEEFARLLWGRSRGTPPTGLETNAPLWYAAGFTEGVRTGTIRRGWGDSLQLRRVVR